MFSSFQSLKKRKKKAILKKKKQNFSGWAKTFKKVCGRGFSQ